MRVANGVLSCLCLLPAIGGAAPLSSRVAETLATQHLPGGAESYVILEADSGKVVASQLPDTPRSPASTIKTVTTFAALDMLGPAFVWRTQAHVLGTLKDGVLDGDLYLQGGGDPYITLERWWSFVQALRAKGLKSIRGDIVLDESAFSLPDASTGKLVHSADLLALGPLVVNFFRGRWCPSCMTELETWRDLYPRVRAAGALFVGISPQTPRQNSFTVEQHHLPFPLLTDAGALLAAQFGIAYTVPPASRDYFRSILVNIPFANSGRSYEAAADAAWRLPLPATLVIRQDSSIAFAEAHADHRVRPDPYEVLAALRH